MSQQEGLQKVAILGGGPAALAAAFELTSHELEGRYEVTIYQLGWRLGGKCASGRNHVEGCEGRIEEHGLHVWFGFYENAFTLMREAYEELGRPETHPLSTLKKAFKGCDEIVLFDRQGDGWQAFPLQAPPNPLEPGLKPDEQVALPGFWDIAKWLCEWSLREFREHVVGEARDVADARAPDGSGPAGDKRLEEELEPYMTDAAPMPAVSGISDAEHVLELLVKLATEAQARGTSTLPPGHLTPAAAADGVVPLDLVEVVEKVLAKMLTWCRDGLWKLIKSRCQSEPHLRLFFTMFDTFASATAGIVNDQVLEKGWEQINDKDLCEWLGLHGAKPVTLGATPAERSPLLRSIYDVAFGYPEGKIENADVAAGTAVNDFLRLAFTYRGSLMYKMQAGMGDTVIFPFYEVLKSRGVKFEFFQAVTALHLNDGATEVQSVELTEQVELGEAGYDPIVIVAELECWPSEPVWSRIPGGEHLKERNPDFEGEIDPLKEGRTKNLVLGRDFDHVVLGIPMGALRPMCDEIAERVPPFAEMLDASCTVRTQAFQVWLMKSPNELGWAYLQNSVAGCYEEPLDTWCDMTHLLEREGWDPAVGVAGIAYFCGVLDERPGETPQQAKDRVFENMADFLEQHIGPLWPDACDRDGCIDWELLADARRGVKGVLRLTSQYWRANVSPSELYVLTPKGSVKHRLPAGGWGVENLFLAGDWTRNGIDGGCVEAAMTSGILAAQALTKGRREVLGVSPTWLSKRYTGPLAVAPALASSAPLGADEQPDAGGETSDEPVGDAP